MSQSKVTDYTTALETLEKLWKCYWEISESLSEYTEDPESFMDDLCNNANNYNDFMNAGCYLREFREWFCKLESDSIH